MPTTLPILRRSAIEAASQCLFRYHKLWIEGVDDQSDYALRGIAFHAAANRYIHRLVEKQIPQDHEEAQAAFLEGIATVPIPGRLIDEVRGLFDRWAEHFALDLASFLVAEERQDTPDQVFTPDLVYGRPHELEIRDFKTYFVALTEVQARADWQARWYIRNAMLKWPGFPQYRFTFDFVRLGKVLSLTFSPDELATLERDVEAVLAMVTHATQTNHWPATAGPACAYCELKCPIVDHPAVYAKRLTADLAPKVGAWILAAEQQLKTIKKSLKEYCVANGSVMVGGVEFANRPVQERRYPIMPVAELLKARGVLGAFDATESEDGLTISHSALGKLFRKFPDIETDLQSVMQGKTSYRFGAKKPGSDEGEAE